MDDETIKLVLAIWGAVLSTVLAIIKIFQDRKESIPKLFIDCREVVNNDKPVIAILIANIWKRPVTISEFNLGLGTDENYQKILYTYSFNPMLKLQDSDPFNIEVEKGALTKSVEKFSNDDFMFARLWINIRLTSGRTIKRTVYLDPKAYHISVNPRYDEFLATAEFFKRDVMGEYNRIWARRMKYEKR